MSARRGRRAALPGGLIGLVGLVIAVESFVSRHEFGLMTYDALNARYAAEVASRSADCGLLCLGDSQVKFGIDPATIEARSDLRARNLAVVGSTTPASYVLLRRALDDGARPSAVLVGHLTFSSGRDEQLNGLAALDGLGDCLELAWQYRDADYFAALAMARAVPSIRERAPIRSALRSLLVDRAWPERFPTPLFWQGWESNRGAEILPTDQSFGGKMEPALEASLFSRRWLVHPVHAHYYRKLMALAASRGITVFWLLAPIAPEAMTYRATRGLDALHTRNVRALQAPHANLIVLDARHSACPASAFVDSCHLNGRGAAWLSDAVATVIRQQREGQLAGSRWVDLPAYAEPSESALALRPGFRGPGRDRGR